MQDTQRAKDAGELLDSAGLALASPAVRRLAREQGVPLQAVTGTGSNGRISRGMQVGVDRICCLPHHINRVSSLFAAAEDILRHIEGATSPGPQASRASEAHSGQYPADKPLPSQEPQKVSCVIQLHGYRRAMVRSMTAAAQVPHFHYCDEVDMGALLRLRNILQQDKMLQGVKLTSLPVVLKVRSSPLPSFVS